MLGSLPIGGKGPEGGPLGAVSRGSSIGAGEGGLYCELVFSTRDHLLASQPEGGAPMEVPRRSAPGGGRFLKMTVEFKLLTKPLTLGPWGEDPCLGDLAAGPQFRGRDLAGRALFPPLFSRSFLP